MALRTRVWSAGKLLVLAGALAATYVAVRRRVDAARAARPAKSRFRISTNRRPTRRPAIAGDLGLTLRVDDIRRPDPKIAAGQRPRAGPAGGLDRPAPAQHPRLAERRRQRAPPCRCSSAKPSAPRSCGWRRTASRWRTVAEIRSPDYRARRRGRPGRRRRRPPARAWRSSSTAASDGASYVMPDLIGVNGDRAAEILRGHGFRVAVVGSNPYPGVAAGIVLRQSPQGGFQIAPGEPISLEVSR